MATCKDCMHYDLCRSCSRIQLGWNVNTVGYVENVEEICKHFADSSRFVELPCKVGDAVFSNVLGKMLEDKITSINIYENGARVLLGRGLWFDIEYIGSVIFLTREEAELALKERENNG